MDLGGTLRGTWKAQCDVYRAVSKATKGTEAGPLVASVELTGGGELQPKAAKVVYGIHSAAAGESLVLVEWTCRKLLLARGPIVETLKVAGIKKTRGSLKLVANEYDLGRVIIRIGKAINEHEGKLWGVFLAITSEDALHANDTSFLKQPLECLQRYSERKTFHLVVLPDVSKGFGLDHTYTNKHEALQISHLTSSFVQANGSNGEAGGMPSAYSMFAT
mmetsp:Transcript_6133/g.38098  ORF Transcript_6133/g.38098 Transcript_6133/m.38098 type:complete len:219 (-) Transcript_6133:2678-3334(-)